MVSRAEWKWVAGWSIALLLLSAVPYMLGAALETPERVFSGFFVAVEDGNHYVAAMRQGMAGRWLFTIPFTPEAHQPIFAYGFYMLLGKAAGTLDLSLPLTLHLAKMVTTPFLLVSVYRFAAQFTARRVVRRLCWLLTAAGGGLGWLWVVTGQPIRPGAMPTDLWVPDASAFLSMLTFPHLALAQALVLLMAVSGLRLLHQPHWRRALLTGLLGLLLSLVHPYSLPVILGLLGLCWAWQAWRTRRVEWKSLLQIVLAALVAAPYVVYSLAVLTDNPVFRSWQKQDYTPSPDGVYYLLGFGLLCPLALVGLLRRRPLAGWTDHALLTLWVVLLPLALYSPTHLQRRFVNAYQVALILVAVAGLLTLLRYVRPRWRRRAVAAVSALSALTSLVLLVGFTALVAGRPPVVFNQGVVVDAMDWLAENAAPDSVVLVAYDTGNLLPTRALVRSFVGHGSETVDVDTKMAQVKAFFSDTMNDAERLALIRTYRIAYVFHGPSERALGAFEPAHLPGLRMVYANAGVSIYLVR